MTSETYGKTEDLHRVRRSESNLQHALILSLKAQVDDTRLGHACRPGLITGRDVLSQSQIAAGLNVLEAITEARGALLDYPLENVGRTSSTSVSSSKLSNSIWVMRLLE